MTTSTDEIPADSMDNEVFKMRINHCRKEILLKPIDETDGNSSYDYTKNDYDNRNKILSEAKIFFTEVDGGYNELGEIWYTRTAVFYIDENLYNKNLHRTENGQDMSDFLIQGFKTYFDDFSWGYYLKGKISLFIDELPECQNAVAPSKIIFDDKIANINESLGYDEVQKLWQKSYEKIDAEPELAILNARRMIESVHMHILEDASIPYDEKKLDYKILQKLLNLSPEKQTEEIFISILKGADEVSKGIGKIRNNYGSHGKGRRFKKPEPRHARFAVNLAGATALFLMETWIAKKEKQESQKVAA